MPSRFVSCGKPETKILPKWGKGYRLHWGGRRRGEKKVWTGENNELVDETYDLKIWIASVVYYMFLTNKILMWICNWTGMAQNPCKSLYRSLYSIKLTGTAQRESDKAGLSSPYTYSSLSSKHFCLWQINACFDMKRVWTALPVWEINLLPSVLLTVEKSLLWSFQHSQ